VGRLLTPPPLPKNGDKMLDSDENTAAIRIGQTIIDRFTIPLVFDERYIIWEKNGESDLFTVFWFKDDVFILDFFRNQHAGINLACRVEQEGSLLNTLGPNGAFHYRIIPNYNQQNSFIEIAGVSLHRFPVENGMVIVNDGQVMIMNRLIDGVLLGMHVYPDSSVKFYTNLPDQVKALLLQRDNPISTQIAEE
jgi:hypothetical protein